MWGFNWEKLLKTTYRSAGSETVGTILNRAVRVSLKGDI